MTLEPGRKVLATFADQALALQLVTHAIMMACVPTQWPVHAKEQVRLPAKPSRRHLTQCIGRPVPGIGRF